MTQQNLDFGTSSSNDGEVLFSAFTKMQANFDDLYAVAPYRFSIKHYGAVVDGVTNDLAAVNLAIAACVAAGGGVVYFPPGTTFISGAINNQTNPTSGVSFEGAGRDVSTIKLSASSADSAIFLIRFASNFHVRGLTLDANSVNATVDGTLVCVQCTNFDISDNRIKNYIRYGIAMNSVANPTINKNRIERTTYENTIPNEAIVVASTISTSTNVTITNNYCLYSGIEVYASGSFIDGNYIEATGFGAGIVTDVAPSSQYACISNNVCAGGVGTDSNVVAVQGIECGAVFSTITGNVCYSNAGAGITVFGRDTTVTGNLCFNNGTVTSGPSKSSYGIVMADNFIGTNSSNSVLSGNRCFDTSGAGGTQEYGYGETSAALVGIKLDGNHFADNKLGQYSLMSVQSSVGIVGTDTAFVVGDILQASSTTEFTRLAAVATGNALISGGIGTASAWGKISNSIFRQSAGLSIVGRSANTTGDVDDITGTDGQVLRVSGTALGFGTIVAAGIASDAVVTAKILDANVTYAKIANGTGLSVLGRSANSGGVNADIVGTDGQVLRVSGTALGFGTIVAAGIASDAVTTVKILNSNVTLAKIANGTALSVLGVTGNAGAAYADMVAASDGQVMRRSGSAVGFGAVDLTNAASAAAVGTTYAPTVTPGSGSYTTVVKSGRSVTIGKFVQATMDVLYTTVGTGGTSTAITMPSTSNSTAMFVGVEFAVTGAGLFGYTGGGNSIVLRKMSDSTVFVPTDGMHVILDGVYEST